MGTMTLTQLENEIRYNLGGRTDLDSRLVTFVNWSQDAIARPRQNLRELREINTDQSTTADTETVALPSRTRRLFSIRLIDGTNSRKLEFIPERKMDKYMPKPDAYATARPTHYGVWGNTLYFWRVPDDEYVLRIRREKWPTALSGASDTSDLDGLDEAITLLATAKAFRSLKMFKESVAHATEAQKILGEYDEGHGSPHPDQTFKADYTFSDSHLDYWADPFVRRSP